MTGENSNNNDYYKVLGLHKDCTQFELKLAYKKLALRWHPDRCSSSGNSKFVVEEANSKFQAIQSAYSVLSDETKRFLYDVGVYDNDDDENNNGMGEFLNEMATMMCENKPSENGEESLEQLQDLFEELFQMNSGDAFASTSQTTTPCSSMFFSPVENSRISNKRGCSEMNNVEPPSPFSSAHLQSFSVGADYKENPREQKEANKRVEGEASNRRHGRKQKLSFRHDVSTNDYTGIST